MSNKHVGAAWDVEGLTVYEKIVLLALSDDANVETGECWRGQKNLAKRCSISRDTVNRVITSLVKKGLISSTHIFDEDGRQRNNKYKLLTGGGCGWGRHTGVAGADTGGVAGADTSYDLVVEDPVVGRTISSEPKNSAHELIYNPGSGFFFPTCRKGVEWEAPKKKIAEWEESYPNVDVPETFMEIRQWLRDNPGKRKTASGMPRFIGRWFQRVQDS